MISKGFTRPDMPSKECFLLHWKHLQKLTACSAEGFGKDVLGLNAIAFKGIHCVYFRRKPIRNHLVKPWKFYASQQPFNVLWYVLNLSTILVDWEQSLVYLRISRVVLHVQSVKLREARREYKNLIRGHLESVSFYELQGRFARRQCARTWVDSPDVYLSFFKPQKRNKLEW